LSRVQQLYQLQVLDSEIDQVRHRLAEIETSLGENEHLNRAEAGVTTAEKKLHEARARMKDLDLEVKGLTEKITREEKTLYGGGARSPKEAANLQEEIASLKRRQEGREELLLQVMVEIESTESELGQLQADLNAVREDWALVQEKLQQEQALLQARVAQLAEQRPAVAGGIAREDLVHYQALRRTKAGRAVALIKDGVCQGCGMTASSNKVRQARMGEELAYCGVCGRILYVL
jgi:predicted  nucleic acid-binding Zn-ribbon protein